MSGEEFKAERERLGYTQESLAKLLGIHRCSLIRLEKKPSISELWAYTIQAIPEKKTNSSKV